MRFRSGAAACSSRESGARTTSRCRRSLSFTLPGDVSASARYWEEDIIDPPVTVSARGTIKAPDAPGIGFAINLPRIEALTVRKETIK